MTIIVSCTLVLEVSQFHDFTEYSYIADGDYQNTYVIKDRKLKEGNYLMSEYLDNRKISYSTIYTIKEPQNNGEHGYDSSLKYFNIISYDDIKDHEYEISSGRIANGENANELICDNLEKAFKVGEAYNVSLSRFYNGEETKLLDIPKVECVGRYYNGPFVTKCIDGGGATLVVKRDLINNLKEKIKSYREDSSLITYLLVNLNYNELNDIKAIYEDILNTMINTFDITNFAENYELLKKVYNFDEYGETKRTQIYMVYFVSISLLVTLALYSLSTFGKDEKTYGIYLLCGTTKKELYLIVIFKLFISFIVSTTISVCFILYNDLNGLKITNDFRMPETYPKFIFIAIAFAILIYLLVFYLRIRPIRKSSIAANLRKDL